MSFGWVFLAASILTYGVANLLQSAAAERVDVHADLHPRLLLRLAAHRVYVVGLVCQVLAFGFAFVARRDLPLFLVQSAIAAGLGVTVVLGVLVLRWRHPVAEVVLLGTLVVGLGSLVLSAEASQAEDVAPGVVVALALSVPAVGLLGRVAAPLRGAAGSVALGALAGLSFGAIAIASRPLAASGSVGEFVRDPLLYVFLAHTAVGQLLLALAMQRGSTTAAVAAMDAAAAIPPSVVGLLLLGDRIAPGREWLAVAGFVLTLGSVVLLTRYAEPQHHVRERFCHRDAAGRPDAAEGTVGGPAPGDGPAGGLAGPPTPADGPAEAPGAGVPGALPVR